MRRFVAVDSLCKKCVRLCGYTESTSGSSLHPVNNSRVVPSFIRRVAAYFSAVNHSLAILLNRVVHTFHSTNNNHHLYINHIIV